VALAGLRPGPQHELGTLVGRITLTGLRRRNNPTHRHCASRKLPDLGVRHTRAMGSRAAENKKPTNPVEHPKGIPGRHALRSLNFFMADMQSGIGPFIGVFLLAHGWQSGWIGSVMTIGSIAGVTMTAPAGRGWTVAGISVGSW